MPRVPQVTRTMKVTNVHALVGDLETETMQEIDLVLPRTYRSYELLSKAIKAEISGKSLVLMKVLHSETKEHLFTMSEAEFVKIAKPLPLRKQSKANSEKADA